MSLELNLIFPNPQQVIVQSRTGTTKPLSFQNPIASQDLQDIRWYLETYSASYTTDVDDQRAEHIEKKLPEWGTALFTATLGQFSAQAAFGQFYAQKKPGRVFTIGASHPDILALPWELLHIPDGNFLFHSKPRISIRRQFNVTGGFNLVEFEPKAAVRILFVVSRPKDAGFIDPRSDAQAVLDALAKEGEGKVAVEFLRPATLSALVERLEDDRQPPVDIIHFDGHGVYDPDGRLFQEARASDGLSLTRSTPAEAANMGYLLFEDDKAGRALISAEKLASMLNEQNVGLIVLSACQSAMVGTAENQAEDEKNATDETPESGVMGSVAARLTHSGIPAVLAMTHSVLVATTRKLFGQFYKGLARGQGMGEALDNARRYLYSHPERGIRVRGQHQEITLRLQDWFLPALYQAGADTPLLTESEATAPTPAAPWGNLPELQEAGFWGRSRELWLIERAFVQKTRRLTISGFGGQGKTYLALEAGRWLHRTGMFGRVCLVDYSQYQGQDPVSYAVSVLSTVLEQSFVDAEAVTQALSTAAPVLLILDNLEALATEPQRALLDTAKVWSETGATRVLLTTRQPEFGHPDYPIEGSLRHQRLQLRGLGSEKYPDDALAYFQALMTLPPEPRVPQPQRGALVKLLSLVDFHPLSIGLLTRQLKERRIAEVGQRLAQLLLEGAERNPLVASLMVSLDRVDEGVRRWLPRLGVFEGGAFEDDLLAITGIGRTDQEAQALQTRQVIEQLLNIGVGNWTPENTGLANEQLQQIRQALQANPHFLQEELAKLPEARELSADVDETTWPTLRQALEASGLIQAESIPGIGVPYLKFHPTLAPALWPQLTAEEQADLRTRHRQRYYQLSGYLYQKDSKDPLFARAIARRELPNLMQAVNRAIAANDPDAVEFVEKVNKFLNYFGLSQDRAALTQKLTQLQGEVGSRTWYLAWSNQGEALWAAGQNVAALEVFTAVLQGLDEQPSYEQCTTLNRIGRCLRAQGQAAQAVECYRKGIAVAEQLEQSDDVKRQRGTMQTDLGDVLTDMGDFEGARSAYEAALAIDQKIGGDDRGTAVTQGQLGTLAIVQGNLQEAAQRYQEALQTFRQLNEPEQEAAVWHQLGVVYQKAKDWDAADRHYRESAKLEEAQGNLAGAAQTWHQLALVSKGAGKIEAAKAWYEKAIAGSKVSGDTANLSKMLSNLADLLQSQLNPSPNDLATARHHAEEALAIDQTLDPAAAEIWKTYNVLAEIAEKQGQTAEARAYRQQARQAKAGYAGTQYELRRFAPLIAGVVMAVGGDIEELEAFESAMQSAPSQWTKLIAAIRQILNGERDEATLVDPLNFQDSMIIHAILQGIADPTTLQALLGEET